MKRLLLIILLLMLIVSAYSQVGIGNTAPNTSSILDLSNENKRGLLLPKAVHGLPTTPGGLLYFSDDDSVIYYNGGKELVQLSVNEMPSHGHSTTQTDHSHKQSASWGWSDSPDADGFKYENPDSGTFQDRYNNTSSEKINITVNNTGGGNAHENRPPYYALAFIYKL
jgi:microcystin-dependent protein